MQTLYGVKITDRVTIKEEDPTTFRYFFDGQEIGVTNSGRAAANLSIQWLQERAKQRERDAELAALDEQYKQENADGEFIHDLATRLGIDPSDLDELIEIAKRRTT